MMTSQVADGNGNVYHRAQARAVIPVLQRRISFGQAMKPLGLSVNVVCPCVQDANAGGAPALSALGKPRPAAKAVATPRARQNAG